MDVLPAFLDHLTRERRMAAKTVESYGSNLSFFLAFLRVHMSGEPSLKLLADVRARDIRAYLAERRR